MKFNAKNRHRVDGYKENFVNDLRNTLNKKDNRKK